MANNSPVDIILDMVVGSNTTPIDSSSDSKFGTNCVKSDNLVPVFDNNNDMKSTKSPMNIFSFKKTIIKKIFGSKKKNRANKNSDIDISAIDNAIDICRKGFKPNFKFYFSETKIGRDLFGYDLDFNEINKDKNKLNNDFKKDNNNSHDKENLGLFFNHILAATSEFTEEEVLELEMRILKIIKCMKGKRDLKQHLRRYATAMSFREPQFFNELRCNI